MEWERMTIEKSKYSSRLTETEVEAIRAAPFAMRHTDVARRYGVTPTTVARIRKGLTWPPRTHDSLKVRVPTEVMPVIEQAAREQEISTEALASDVLTRWASRRQAK
jgi:hypothetical protein